MAKHKIAINGLKKIVVTLIGGPIFIIGLILIPLPGPGILICILGLYILSKGYDQLHDLLEKYKQVIVNIYKDAKQRHDDFLKKHDL
jgi:uncharacterized membrane protein